MSEHHRRAGHARTAALSPERRSQIAKTAAHARWHSLQPLSPRQLSKPTREIMIRRSLRKVRRQLADLTRSVDELAAWLGE